MTDAPRFAELQVSSHFSFLRGASSCEELFRRAAELGIEALGLVDRNSLAGLVRAHVAAKESGVRLVVGCRLDLTDGPSILVYPMDRVGYGRLCRLLTLGKQRAGKGECHLEWADLAAGCDGLIGILLPEEPDGGCAAQLARLRAAFADRAYMALTLRRRPDDQLQLHELSNLAAQAGVATVVTGDVLYHTPDRRPLQDVMTCVRHGCTIDDLGYRRERCADRHLKAPAEMHRLYARYPEALARGLEIVDRCRFSLDELAYQYPDEREYSDETPQQALERLSREAAADRYPDGVPEKVQASLEHELALIGRLDYAPYFLTVNSIVRFARSQGILCQGRGSAANSVVCYLLGITAIDPEKHDLLFERFVSEARREPPDIDVDFEHQRREEVIQWVYETYGRRRAALCATVIRYRAKGAMRDVGKALGLPVDLVERLAEQIHDDGGLAEPVAPEGTGGMDRRVRLTLELAGQLMGTPRHLSQHPGGFVLTRERLDELVPVEPAAMELRQVIEWDKEDIAVLGFMKVDCLALGMLSCMKRAFDLLADHKGIDLDLAGIPQEDPATYAMIRRADTVGVFQIESRAQMNMLPRLKPRTFYDLVIEVAIVRPGPIQGDMVHPYLQRREGLEPVSYPTPALKRVLGKTLGVPLFQEQAMRVAIECAGFTPAEADQLRKGMATFKHTGGVVHLEEKLIEGMVANGYGRDYAERTFRQLEGFGSYGFPESHAASFALIAYASSWLKCHHPDIFCTALLNAQPMGFYAPAQIVRDACEHGVEVRPVCINASRWDCTLEPVAGQKQLAVRLGFSLVKGLGTAEAAELVASRGERPFAGVEDLRWRTRLPMASLETLARADAFLPAFGLERREALWAIRALGDTPLPLFAAADEREESRSVEVEEPAVDLKPMTAGNAVVQDYRQLGLSLRAHPLAFLRDTLRRKRVDCCSEVLALRDGAKTETAGLVLVRQRPGSAKGVVFVTLEDETGTVNCVVWPDLLKRERACILSASLLRVRGTIQKEGEVVHLIAREVEDFSGLLDRVPRCGHEQRNNKSGRLKNVAHEEQDSGKGQDPLRVRSRDFH